jgi:peptidoglycan/LPS O-acetylase OafA/YrhL
MAKGKVKYPSIGGLRAISVILVIIFHLNLQQHIFHNLEKYPLLAPILSFLQDGQLGVNVFFVISGFLITSLLMEEERLNKAISLKGFYIRRTLRIFPAYYFLLFVYLLLQLDGIIKLLIPFAPFCFLQFLYMSAPVLPPLAE